MDTSAELETLQKRVEAIAQAVEGLRVEQLSIVQAMLSAMCTIEYNLFGLGVPLEQREAYKKAFGDRLNGTTKRLTESRTREEAFAIFYKFDHELVDFVRAAKVQTAEQATEIAHLFIKKYSPVALPLKAVRQDDVWLVDIDVGALAVKVAKVRVDARTGDVVGYEIPEK